jgi:transcriptional regulator with XRE-family HTH domain
MTKRRRTTTALQASRALQPIASREGGKVRAARRRRRWTQSQLGQRVSLAQETISDLERGRGGTLSLQAWQQVALVLGLRLELTLGRDPLEEPQDAGHLAIEELVLRLGKAMGVKRTFELPTKPANPSLSTDVGLTDDTNRRLIQVECVNTFGNVNAAIRSSNRKCAEAEGLAIAIGHGEPYAVHQVWVVRASRRNRQLLARYPEIFTTRFSGSSLAWVKALTTATAQPPNAPGLVWCDLAATRIFEWRRPGARPGA